MTKRNLYLNNIPVEEALAKYLDALGPPDTGTEPIDVAEALGRVTARAVFARYNSPLYDSAAMDGIAVISRHTTGARENAPLTLRPEKDFIVIDTGDPVRPPYDAVIMAEDIEPQPDGTVVIRAAAAPWQHLRPVGEDIVQGEMILPGLHRVRPMDIGVLLSGGITEIEVLRRPLVSVIPTGSELIEPGQTPGDGDIIESNSRMFAAMAREEGAIARRTPSVPDDYDAIKQTILEQLAVSDMLLVNAGSSAGTEDYTVHVLRELGQVIVHGVAMKPGKPVILAIVEGKPVIGLPGYPVSAYLAYKNFVAPVLARLTGQAQGKSETARAVLSKRLISSLKHREYVRVKVGKVGEKLVAAPLARGAGAAMSLVRADGFCVIPQDCEGLQAGEVVEVLLTKPLAEQENTLVSIGSHDLVMDIIADMMPGHSPGCHLSSSHVGSMAGLMALQRGEAHLAPVHLLDEATGEYNIPAVKTLFPGRPMALIKGLGRTQGIMVKAGNPLHISCVSDLPKGSYVNRQRGAGTRVLLEHLLKQAGVSPADIHGYEREAATHMAVAAAVKNGSADAGLGVLSAAQAMGLDFIPVGQEEYDFAAAPEFLDHPAMGAFVEILKSAAFREKLEALGGYTAPRAGAIVMIGSL